MGLDPEKTYFRSRIQGLKKHRIQDPDPQHCKQDPWPDSVDFGEVVSGWPEGRVQVSRVEATAEAIVSAHRHLTQGHKVQI